MALFRLHNIALLLGLAAGASLALTQAPPAVRPMPPTRDPHTPGYVSAIELPDGSNPPANADGNFIIGPTHQPAAEMSAHQRVPQGTVYEFTMNSAGPLPPRPHLFGHLRQSTVAFESRDPARRMGVSRTPYPGESSQGDSNLDRSGRQRLTQSECHARRYARLGRRQRKHGESARRQRLSLPVCFCPERRP